MSRVPSVAVRALLTSLILTGALGAGTACAATDVGSLHFILGYKSLTSDWNLGPPSADTTARVSQPTMGVELTWGREGWPVMVALDVFHTYDDGIIRVPAFFTVPAFHQRLRASTFETALGLRRTFSVLGWTPHLGAGGSWVRGNAAVEVIDPNAGQFGARTASAHSRASAFGFWAGGGIYRRIGSRFQIGLAGRYSKATLPATPLVVEQGTLPFGLTTTPELDAGGRHINLTIGWAFPARE